MEKKIQVAQLEIGQAFDDLFIIKSVKRGETKAGKAYLLLTLMDRSGEISGPIWENAEQVSSFCTVGAVLHCRGMVASFREQKQLQIEFLEQVPIETVDMTKFLPETRANRREMARELKQVVAGVDDPWLKRLLNCFFGGGAGWEKFQNAAAAKGAHHAYVGGLLEHSLSVAKVASSLASHYPGVNCSLLLAGALLHDIGKMEEMRFLGAVVEYTVPGRLKGHLVIGCEMVAAAAEEISGFPQETLEQLQHLILSHHGQLAYGSPVLPMTVEALLLSMIDDLDAKMNMIEQLRYKLSAGEFSFTEYQRLLERYLYLSGYEEAGKERAQTRELADAPRRTQPTLFEIN